MKGLDLDKLDVEPPQLGRVLAAQIGTRQIATFAPPNLSQLGAIECEGERGAVLRHIDIDEAPRRPCPGARGTELHEQLLAIELHGGDLFEAPP